MSPLQFLVHWVHITAAASWVGATLGTYFVALPSLLQQPAPAARVGFADLTNRMGRFAQIAGQVAFWLGIIRGTVYGPIQSLGDLTRSPYGHTFLTAIVLTIVAIATGATAGRRLERKIWNGDSYRDGAASAVRNGGILSLVLFALILACMAAMRFGV